MDLPVKAIWMETGMFTVTKETVQTIISRLVEKIRLGPLIQQVGSLILIWMYLI